MTCWEWTTGGAEDGGELPSYDVSVSRCVITVTQIAAGVVKVTIDCGDSGTRTEYFSSHNPGTASSTPPSGNSGGPSNPPPNGPSGPPNDPNNTGYGNIGGLVSTLGHASVLVGRSLLQAGTDLGEAATTAIKPIATAAIRNPGMFLHAYGAYLLSSGIQPKVQFDAPIFPGLAGSQSLTINSKGGTVYSVDAVVLGGFLFAGGETFPIYGSPEAQSNWSLGGSGGYLGVLGLEVKFNGLRPTYVSGFAGVGFGLTGELEKPSGSLNLFEGTVDSNGNVDTKTPWGE